MIKLDQLGSLCLPLTFALLPLFAWAQVPDDYIFLDNPPSYIDSWSVSLQGGIGWKQYDAISVDATDVLNTIDSYGEILLPGMSRFELYHEIPTGMATFGGAFRQYKLVDRWESTVYDGSIGGAGANRTYEVATLQGPHNSIAAVVMDPVRYLIVLPFEDWFDGSDRSKCYYIMGEHGSPGSLGYFRYASESEIVPGTSPSPVPFAKSESCETSSDDEGSNLLPPSTNQLPPDDIQDISYIRTSISYALAVENLLNALPVEIPASMWSSAFSALANGILIDELGVLLRHEWVQPTGNEIPVTADSSIFNPDTVGSWDAVFNFEDELFTAEGNLMASVPDFEGVHCGQMFLYGSGGVVFGDACTSEKFRGITRVDQLLHPFHLRTYVHEFSHQFNVMHTFNANDNSKDDLSSTQRVSTSAYEPGSGGTLMSYTHNCSEYWEVIIDDETGELSTFGGNHRVKPEMKVRTKNNRFWAGFGELRDIFHTHSVEQMQDYLAVSCPTVLHTPTVAPTPSIVYEWGMGDPAEMKFVPVGMPYVLSVVPEEHTSYRWHQMDLGPMHSQPDWRAMNTVGDSPRIMANGPTPDGKRFFPPRDSLFDDVKIDHQYVPFVENELVSMSFRVQANRFIPKADLSDSDAANAPYHNSISTGDDIDVVGLVLSMDFGIASGPWDDNGGQLWATQEIGEIEPFYQGVMTWNVDGTDELPWDAASVEVVLVTETVPLQYEVLYTGVPNTGETASLVLNLMPPEPMENGDVPEQRILIRPEGEIFFSLSPPFQVYHAGCTNYAFASYDPHANYHDQSQCDLDGVPDAFYSFSCKDVDACNYSETAFSHDSEDCLYPDCNQLGALNFSFYVGANFPGNEPSTGYCTDGPCVFDAVPCEGDWLDPSGSGMGWGFAHSYAPEEWLLNGFPYGLWSDFNDLSIYDFPYTADIQVSEAAGRIHFTAGTPENDGLSFYQSASMEITSTGLVEFDWQITESNNAGFSNLAFYLDGEPIAFDKGSNWSTMWLVGDGLAPHEGTVSFEADAGQTFRVALTTSVHQTHPIGVILSDFKYTKHSIEGCLNPDALNFNPFATCHNVELCHDASSFDSDALCLDADACNFAGFGTNGFHQPLLCQFPGCDDPSAANFDPFAGCTGPCCYTGGCDFEVDEGSSSPVLWLDWNEAWEEINPLPDFEEVMFLPGGMVMTAPQTTTPGISQSVRYTYNGTGAAPMSFAFSWIPGEMSIPGEMYSPAVMEIWKEGILVQEVSLSATAGSPLDASSDMVVQSYAIPPSQWPSDPFSLSPYLEDGSMTIQSEPTMGAEHYFRTIQAELTENTEIVFKMYGDVEDLVLDNVPCRLLVTGMSLPQNAACNLLSGPLALGCTDEHACNFDAAALVDNGSCIPVGCTDPEAMNYNPDAGCQSTCLYPGDCSNPVTVNASFAAGLVGAFGAGEVELSMAEEHLIFNENLVTIIGPDVSIGSTPNVAGNHSIFWVADEAIEVQFAYAVSSWDNGISYDFPYYQINSQPYLLLDDVNGDEPETAYWLVEHEEWQPSMDLMLPNPSEVPYPDFEENLVFPVKVLKTPILLNEGDTLRIGVESSDNIFGEVVLAVAGMTWTNHCTEDFEDPWILGCKEPDACNYNPYADEDDGSCVFPGMLCDDGDACTFEDHYEANCECVGFFVDSDDDGTCDAEDGCPDNPYLSEEGVCGCETPVDANGNSIFDCMEFCDSDADQDGICDENEVPGCTDATACNFLPGATDDDGSCEYSGPACACTFDIAFNTDSLGPFETTIFTWDGSILSGLESVNVELDFSPITGSNFPSDLIVGICDPNGTCMEFGGYNSTLGYNSMGLFPNNWSVTSAGAYSASFDVLAAGLSGDGTWTFELKNTFSSATSIWEGYFQFVGNCGSPQPTEGCTDDSACNFDPDAATDDGSCAYEGPLCGCTLVAPFDVTLGAGEIDSGTQFASVPGGLLTILVDLEFSPGVSGNFAGDLAIGVCDPNGNCIEVGGYNLDFGFNSYGNFPLGWQTASEGNYLAEFDVADAGLTGTGDWSIHFLNGYSSAGTGAQWAGTVTFAGSCDENVLGCTEASACNYNTEATEDDGSCILPGTECYDLDVCFVGAIYDSNCDCVGTYIDADQDGYCSEEDCDDSNPLLYSDCDIVVGCTDMAACNYDPFALLDDDSCIEPDYWLIPGFEQPGPALPWCGSLDAMPFGYIVGDYYCVDQVVNELITCVNYAWNDFGGGAIQDCEGSYIACQVAAGCMDPTACNYDDTAVEEDGSCLYPGALCAEATACALAAYYDTDCGCNPEPLGVDTDGDGICDEDEVAGCINALACNYNAGATDEDGSCYFIGNLCDWGVPSCSGEFNMINEDCECVPDIPDTDGDGVCDEDEIGGCQDPVAINYDSDATDEDGSCEYDDGWEEIYGCMDTEACNFYSDATMDDGSCEYPQAGYDCQGDCLMDTDGDGICDGEEVEGCTDLEADNYDPEATENDGSCEYGPSLPGCTDPEAINYDPEATEDDGSCNYPLDDDFGCTDAGACNYNPLSVEDDGSCFFPSAEFDCDGNCIDSDGDEVCDSDEVAGCTDGNAINYNSDATDEDGSCEYEELIAGCMDDLACNYDPEAESNDGSCIYPWDEPGCTDPLAANFNPNAVIDDGSCAYLPLIGCTDPAACNFNSDAEVDDGMCEFPNQFQDCSGNCLNDADGDGLCDEQEIWGCMDPWAINFNGVATEDDDSCEYEAVWGCSDMDACNYCFMDCIDDGSCIYPDEFLDCSGNCLNDADGDGLCDEQEIWGCMEQDALNFNFAATEDDGSCEFYFIIGCMDEFACNYHPPAEVDDGSCIYPPPLSDCSGECLVDTDGDGVCDALEVAGCMDELAMNYNAIATDDDGSCSFGLTAGCTYADALNFNVEADYEDGSCEFANEGDACPTDLDNDGTVAVSDLLILLSAYGEECSTNE